jgi:hypothetical protein
MQFLQISAHLSLNKVMKIRLDFYGPFFFFFKSRCNPLRSTSSPNSYFYFLIYTVYIYICKIIVFMKKIGLKILIYLRVFSLAEEGVFGVPTVCIYVHFTSAWMVGQSIFVFSIHSKSVFSESEPKMGPLGVPKSIKWWFCQKCLLHFRNLWKSYL